MKIIFLTPVLPFPANSGGTLKSLKLIEFLSNQHDVDVVTLFSNKKVFEDSSTKLKSKIRVKIDGFFLSRPRNLLNYVLSFLNFIPLSVYRNKSKELEAFLVQNISNYDLVIIDHFLMYQYIDKKVIKKIYHSHNAEFVMWDRFAIEQSNIIKKLLITIESHRIKSFERKILSSVDVVLAAPNDIKELKKITQRESIFIETYHLGDDALLNYNALKFSETEEALLYIGTLTWEANIHGLKWFLNNVWPKLKQKKANLKFHIIGKTNPDDFDEFKKDQAIIWHGFVEDLTYFYNHSRVHVAPLLFGSGIKVKVVSGLYRGIPTVTTDIGIEGLKLEDSKHIMIANDENMFTEKVEMLLDDENLWQKISIESREIAKERYSWDFVFKKLEEAISKC